MSSLSEWTWEVLRRERRRRRRWRWVNTAVNVERIEELVVRAADEAGEEFLVDRGNTDDEVLLGQDGVEPVGSHHVGGYGEPVEVGRFTVGYILILRNTWDMASRRSELGSSRGPRCAEDRDRTPLPLKRND